MNEKELFDTAKNYLQKRLGLYSPGARFAFRHCDPARSATVILIADQRKFEVYINWMSNKIRLTEFQSEDKLQDYRIPVPRAKRVRKPWAMRMRNGRIRYFDTLDEMMAYSSRPEVEWENMGRTENVLK